MDKFLELAAEVFEVEPDEISMDTVFRDEIEDFSSLVGFSLIVMMEDEYGVRVPVDEFLECRTIGDLYRKCVKES
jgi:acyl carrier protein